MDEKRIKRYKEKIEYFKNLMGELNEWTQGLNENDFVNNLSLREQFSIYHAYQIILEIATDLAAMILKDMKIIPKDDYVNFDVLADKKIITKESALNLKQANGLRNRVVHDYNGFDEVIAYKSIQKYFPYLKEYVEDVKRWLPSKN